MNKLEKLVFESIGQASMCWSETPTGIFDEKQATEIAKKLISDLGLEKMADAICFGNSIGKNGKSYDLMAQEKIKEAFDFITQTESIYESFVSDVKSAVENGSYDLNTTQSVQTIKQWPDSSNIATTEYELENAVLIVTFKNSLKYAYQDFPYNKWLELLETESIGKYINNCVKGAYTSQKLESAL